jgi:hypothetical protein
LTDDQSKTPGEHRNKTAILITKGEHMELSLENKSVDDPLTQQERDDLVAALRNLDLAGEVKIHEARPRVRVGEMASFDALWHLMIGAGSSTVLIAFVRGMFKVIDARTRQKIKIKVNGLSLEMPAGASLPELEEFIKNLRSEESKKSKTTKTESEVLEATAKEKEKTSHQSRRVKSKQSGQAHERGD